MANTTASPFQLDCEASDKTLYKFYAAAMIVIFILALPLNASILYLFIFKLKFWKSNSNNIFLFNLVLADILLIFCLPVIAYNYIQGERRIENDAGYKAMLFMLFLNRGGSIAFLTVISIDRYLHVVHHGRRNLLKVLKKSALISILIWLFLVPLTIPTMLKNFDCNRIPNENKVMFPCWMCNLPHPLTLTCYWQVFSESQKAGIIQYTLLPPGGGGESFWAQWCCKHKNSK